MYENTGSVETTACALSCRSLGRATTGATLFEGSDLVSQGNQHRRRYGLVVSTEKSCQHVRMGLCHGMVLLEPRSRHGQPSVPRLLGICRCAVRSRVRISRMERGYTVRSTKRRLSLQSCLSNMFGLGEGGEGKILLLLLSVLGFSFFSASLMAVSGYASRWDREKSGHSIGCVRVWAGRRRALGGIVTYTYVLSFTVRRGSGRTFFFVSLVPSFQRHNHHLIHVQQSITPIPGKV
jgi:hypothetical protein